MDEKSARDSLSKCLCRRFGCKPEEVEKRLLVASIPWWKRPFWHVATGLGISFERDSAIVRDACKATSLEEISEVIYDEHYRGRGSPDFWRHGLGLRALGGRLYSIASREFAEK